MVFIQRYFEPRWHKKSATLQRLVQMLAYRIGSEINYSSLANELGISRLTVEKYIDILEKISIVFSLHAFSKTKIMSLKKEEKSIFGTMGFAIESSKLQSY